MKKQPPIKVDISKMLKLTNKDALETNVYERQIWNTAIEAAALIVQPVPHINEERRCEDIAASIRKLKK